MRWAMLSVVDAHDAVARAQRLADDVLFPDGDEVEAAGVVPERHLRLLAEAGLFAVARDVRSADEFHAVIEALAGGCTSTAFVWLQHHGLVRHLLRPDAPGALRDRYLDDLCAGRVRAGVAQAGLLPGEPRLRATATPDGGVRLDGSSPWVTGWGLVDVLLVAARRADDPGTVVWLVLDAVEATGVRAEPLRLAAVDPARTVVLHLDGAMVEPGRVIGADPYEAVGYAAGTGLRTNGSLSLGLAARCARLVGSSELEARVVEVRSALDVADDATLPAARAAASRLALDAAAALVVHGGGASVVRGATAERLAREALFLLVFGSRPSIRSELSALFAAGG